MQTQEVIGIKDAFKEAFKDKNKNVKITFVACMNQHNVVIVPKDKVLKRNGKTIENVKSGTCVDASTFLLPLKNLSVEDTEDNGSLIIGQEANQHSFFLTSQNGLKGTSKAVLYRTLLNDNPLLDADTLQNITYSMSYQYGTATKAVRGVPVVYYSRRLAEQMIRFLPYLTEPDHENGKTLVVKRDIGDDEIRYSRHDWESEEMLPSFSPGSRKPFCPHLSA